MNDCECLEFPSFEAFDAVDRPPPPSITDYPIGCEVDLVDIDLARTAQTPEFWEPFMDTLFSQGRQSVRVVRHQGDYTFVVCEKNPELIIGCTLYRACLSEPKVRFKKYIPSHSTGTNTISMGDKTGASTGGGSLLDSYVGCHEELFKLKNFALSRHAAAAVVSVDNDARSRCWRSTTPVAALRRSHNSDSNLRTVTPTSEALKMAETERIKYNYATKKAYNALCKKNYAEALNYYTKALKYSRDGGARCLSNRSLAYLGLQNLEAAFNDAIAVINLTPNSYIGYVRAANTLRRMRRYEEARSYYEKALAIDPSKEILKYLFLSNSVAMLYAAKLEHKKVASVILDRETTSVVLIAKKSMHPGDLAWTATSTLITTLGNYRSIGNGNKSVDEVSCSSNNDIMAKLCQNCYRPLTKPSVFCDSLPNIQSSLLCKLYTFHAPVQCNGQCGTFYCSDVCRSKAWAAHHWVECPVNGKWSEAFHRIPKLLRDFAVGHNSGVIGVTMSQSESQRKNIAAASESCVFSYEKGLCLPLLAFDDFDVILACVYIACRMFTCIISDVLPLKDAVHLYDWMLPSESDCNNYRDGNNDDRMYMSKVILDKVILPVYALLEECFTTEEKQYLNFNIFFNCYQRARFNCLKLRVSVWPSIQEKAKGYLDVFRACNCDFSNSSAHGSSLEDNSGSWGQHEPNLTHLKCIVDTPPESMPECFECIAVFKVFAATFCGSLLHGTKNLTNNSKNINTDGGDKSHNNSTDGEGFAPCNVRVRSSVELGAFVHIDVTKKISVGEKLVAEQTFGVLRS